MFLTRFNLSAIGLALLLLASTPFVSAQTSDGQDEAVADAFFQSAFEALAKQNYRAAVFNLQRSLELRPNNSDGWRKLGFAQSHLREWEPALLAYRKALEIEPGHAKTYHNVGNVYFRKGDTEQAAAAYGKALELDPGYMLAAFHYGWTLRQLNRAEEAERAFEQCLKIEATLFRHEDTHADCLFGVASLRYRANDFEAAAEKFEKVLEYYPKHREARYYLGLSYRRLGRKEEAKEQLAIHKKLMEALRSKTEISEGPADP